MKILWVITDTAPHDRGSDNNNMHISSGRKWEEGAASEFLYDNETYAAQL